MNSVVLYGFKGAGKTTLGREFAYAYGLNFIDTDAQLCATLGWKDSVAALHAVLGESSFREEESKMIQNITTGDGLVVSTGGGAVLCADNVTHFRKIGRLIYLDAPAVQLYKQSGPNNIFSCESTFARYYQSRIAYYPTISDARIDMTTPNVIEQLHAIAMGAGNNGQ